MGTLMALHEVSKVMEICNQYMVLGEVVAPKDTLPIGLGKIVIEIIVPPSGPSDGVMVDPKMILMEQVLISS